MEIKARFLPWYASWKGLLGSKKTHPIYFYTRWGIHTFGMREEIDVLIIDKGIIQKIKENLVPNRLFFWNPTFSLVVELPKGTIKKLHLHIGERITLATL